MTNILTEEELNLLREANGGRIWFTNDTEKHTLGRQLLERGFFKVLYSSDRGVMMTATHKATKELIQRAEESSRII